MGTRSLTRFFDGDKPVFNMYRQMDGYPSGHGAELAAFLREITMVNGLGGERKNIANGAGCLGAQIVAHFKNSAGAGGIYLYPVDASNVGEEYQYIVKVGDNDEIAISVIQYNGEVIFAGDRDAFKSFCEQVDVE